MECKLENAKQKIIEHDFAIDNIAKSLENLSDAYEKTNEEIELIVKSMSKQEVILERLANMEEVSKDRINVVHKRIDKIESMIAWVLRTAFGALLTGAIGMLFYIDKG